MIMNQKALCLMQIENYQEALQIVDLCLELIPDNYESLINKAIIFKELKKPNEGLKIFNELIEKNKDNLIILSEKADCLRILKRF